MNNIEFVNKVVDVATKNKTLYVMGCFGAPMNSENKRRYSSNHSYNKQKDRAKLISSATSDTFGFDCVGLIKSILWGFNADPHKVYGGAKYQSNGVPDINADSLIKLCNPSTNFSEIEVGEVVWVKGHIGVYIGSNQVVECTPKWANNVQITYLGNRPEFKRDKSRVWTSHGKLPYITYKPIEIKAPESQNKPSDEAKPTTPTESTTLPFKVGDRVKIVGEKYHPDSATIVPSWVKRDYIHIVTQTSYRGKIVYKGGKECVLLGRKINKNNLKESVGIHTWVAIDSLSLTNLTK